MDGDQAPLPTLLEALDLARLDEDRYEGRSVERLRPRMFGGELLAQVVMAGARTLEDRACHSVHVDFLLPGDPTLPVEYRVRRVRDGRRFAQRQVSGFQRGREIVLASVSFTTEAGDAVAYQHERMPEVPGPEGLVSEIEERIAVADRMRPEDRPWLLMPRAVEVRQVRPVPLFDPPPVPPVAYTWLKAVAPMPDAPALHCAVLAYASDTTLLDIACYPHGLSWIDPRAQQASLTHAMWFHRPFRVDEWLLYAQTVPTVAGGRALARGSVFTRDGALVASVVQEGLSQVAPADSALGGS
jgi:acyl-CoA thioesterase-2